MVSIDRPGSTLVAEQGPRWFAIVITALYGAGAFFPVVGGKVDRSLLDRWSPRWVTHVPATAVAADLAIVAIALIWGCSRSWRMGLSMDDKGVTVRNYFRTYRVGWHEVKSLADGSVFPSTRLNDERLWAASVLMHSGRAVTATGTVRLGRARPEALTAINRTAAFYGIAAGLTGAPGAWRGSKWQSSLPLLVAAILIALFLAGEFLISGGVHCPPPSCAS